MKKSAQLKKTFKDKKFIFQKEKLDKLKKEFYYVCSCCAIVLLLIISGLNINNYLTKQKILGSETNITSEESKLNQQRDYWENFQRQNPTYFEGWIELTNIYYQEGNLDKAKQTLTEAAVINPNSDKIIEMRSLLNEGN